MRLEIHATMDETIDNLTFASAIVKLCNACENLDCVKIANAILIEMVGEE